MNMEEAREAGFSVASDTVRRRSPPKCPERSEQYRAVEQNVQGSNVQLNDERHGVSTQMEVTVVNGEARLRITARCQCGWSDTTVLPEVTGDGDE